MRLVRLFNWPGIWLTIPFFLFLVIHQTTKPGLVPESDSPVDITGPFAYHDHIDYPVYNPGCAKFTGNVDLPEYASYTEKHLDFPIFAGNATFPNVKYHFAVNSAPKSYLARRVIRQTWQRTLEENIISGKTACSGSVRFYVGQSNDKKIARNLQRELKEHQDMVFIEFCDKYETLPLKTFNIMKHIAVTVPKTTEWIIKIDDDVLPNFPIFFDCFPTLEHQNFGIYGWVTVDNVILDKWDKYRIPVNRWNGTKFPGFTHGPSYAVRAAELPKLLAIARKTPMVNLEDVWFTGIVAEAAKVRRFDVLRFIVGGRNGVDLKHNVHHTDKAGFFYHNIGPIMMKKFWRRISKCCGCCQHCDMFKPKPTTKSPMKSELLLEEDELKT